MDQEHHEGLNSWGPLPGDWRGSGEGKGSMSITNTNLTQTKVLFRATRETTEKVPALAV